MDDRKKVEDAPFALNETTLDAPFVHRVDAEVAAHCLDYELIRRSIGTRNASWPAIHGTVTRGNKVDRMAARRYFQA